MLFRSTYEPGDADSLARAIVALLDDRDLRDSAVAATTTRIRGLSWEHEADRLAALVQRLAPDRLSS